MSFSTTGSVFAKRAPRKETLCVLVCGATGTGKSSFINTLVGRRVLFDSDTPSLPASSTSSLRFQPTTVEPEEPLSDGSRLVLTLIETEGFGVNIDHASDIEQVADYIECRFDEVLAEESRIRRNPRFKDNRVDACLYFIEPTGHGLRELDILTLKRLSSIVNVIPVLARADSLTPSERVANKRLISEDLRFHDIEIFDFQYTDESGAPAAGNSEGQAGSEPEENELYSAIPFAIISSSEFNDNGESLFKRLLPYGTAEVLNAEHCDFKLLRSALLDSFLIELKDRTHLVLYETFRTHRLDPQQNHRASLLLPQELADHAARLKQAQIDRETALLREEERRVNAEIEAKRSMLLKRERELRELEQRMSDTRPAAARKPAPDSSQPSSATSTQFPSSEASPNVSEIPNRETPVTSAVNPYMSPYGTPMSHEFPANPYGSAAEQAAALEESAQATHGDGASVETAQQPNAEQVNAQQSTAQADGYVDGPAVEHASEGASTETELRVRQRRSKKELREHADKLHAELGNLEAQKQDIQRQVATASSRALHSQLPTDTSSLDSKLASLGSSLPAESADPDATNTSPLNIKKTAAA